MGGGIGAGDWGLRNMAVIEHLSAYRAKLLKAGKLLEARAVARCIVLLRLENKL